MKLKSNLLGIHLNRVAWLVIDHFNS